MTIFTVKWVYSVNGVQHERLIEADQVRVAYDDRTPDAKDDPKYPQKLGIYNIPKNGGVVVLGNCYEGADSTALTFGTIFIMNRDGKTVSKYHLQAAPPWVDGTDRPEKFSEAMPAELVPGAANKVA